MTEGSQVTWTAWGPAHSTITSASRRGQKQNLRGQQWRESRSLASAVLGGLSRIQAGKGCEQEMVAAPLVPISHLSSRGLVLCFFQQEGASWKLKTLNLLRRNWSPSAQIGSMAVSVCWWSMQSVSEAFCKKLEKAGRGFLQSFFGSDYSFIYKRSFRPSVAFQCNWEKTMSFPGLYKCAKKARLQRLLELIKQRQKSCLLWWGGGRRTQGWGLFPSSALLCFPFCLTFVIKASAPLL